MWQLVLSRARGVTAHDAAVRDKGGSPEQVQDAVRIAAIVHATAIALEVAPAAATVAA